MQFCHLSYRSDSAVASRAQQPAPGPACFYIKPTCMHKATSEIAVYKYIFKNLSNPKKIKPQFPRFSVSNRILVSSKATAPDLRSGRTQWNYLKNWFSLPSFPNTVALQASFFTRCENRCRSVFELATPKKKTGIFFIGSLLSCVGNQPAVQSCFEQPVCGNQPVFL